jgi:hypothetical protein
MSDITACVNESCEHGVSCYRAKLRREHTPDTFGVFAHFSRDPKLARQMGFDCYWPIKEPSHDRRAEAKTQ